MEEESSPTTPQAVSILSVAETPAERTIQSQTLFTETQEITGLERMTHARNYQEWTAAIRKMAETCRTLNRQVLDEQERSDKLQFDQYKARAALVDIQLAQGITRLGGELWTARNLAAEKAQELANTSPEYEHQVKALEQELATAKKRETAVQNLINKATVGHSIDTRLRTMQSGLADMMERINVLLARDANLPASKDED
ncbi:hypothetical protein EG329_004276 [Mollisiaceae sp. DMI_Dod_QoI]|nr:hypothetical protein EG329_004276 [Helotiales sp. DMI_Dod_QoI]